MLTGWQDKWNDAKAFFDIDAKGDLHFPGFAPSTTAWPVSERKAHRRRPRCARP